MSAKDTREFKHKEVNKQLPDIAPIGPPWKLSHKVGCDSEESGRENAGEAHFTVKLKSGLAKWGLGP